MRHKPRALGHHHRVISREVRHFAKLKLLPTDCFMVVTTVTLLLYDPTLLHLLWWNVKQTVSSRAQIDQLALTSRKQNFEMWKAADRPSPPTHYRPLSSDKLKYAKKCLLCTEMDFGRFHSQQRLKKSKKARLARSIDDSPSKTSTMFSDSMKKELWNLTPKRLNVPSVFAVAAVISNTTTKSDGRLFIDSAPVKFAYLLLPLATIGRFSLREKC